MSGDSGIPAAAVRVHNRPGGHSPPGVHNILPDCFSSFCQKASSSALRTSSQAGSWFVLILISNGLLLFLPGTEDRLSAGPADDSYENDSPENAEAVDADILHRGGPSRHEGLMVFISAGKAHADDSRHQHQEKTVEPVHIERKETATARAKYSVIWASFRVIKLILSAHWESCHSSCPPSKI